MQRQQSIVHTCVYFVFAKTGNAHLYKNSACAVDIEYIVAELAGARSMNLIHAIHFVYDRHSGSLQINVWV